MFTSGYEAPQYEVVLSEENKELRRYPEELMVTTSEEGESSAFRRLFRYISGENKAEEKISMTVPVRKSMPDEKPAALSFFLPDAYKDKPLPEPQEEEVSVERVPAGTFAALRFSGTTGKERIAEKERELRAWLQAQGKTIEGPLLLDRYNAPWTPWFMKTNEILFRIVEE